MSSRLQLGGALGNLVDRVRQGYVVDFVDLSWWPVFNLADAAILVGVAILGYYWIPFFNRIHTLGKPAFIVLIALHVLAVLWHQLYKRDGVFMRMVKPAPQPVITDAIGGSPPAA